MPYSRQRPRIAPTGRVTIRLTLWPRDLFIHSPATPKYLGHLLRHVPVKKEKLEIAVSREALDQLIAVAAKSSVAGKEAEHALDTFLLYLETIADRFEEPEPDSGSTEGSREGTTEDANSSS